MTSIYLAANRVPLGPSYVHLQLVYNNTEFEVQSGLTWQFKTGVHDDPDRTPHFGEADWYDSIAIDIGDRSADQVWATLTQVYDTFIGQMSDAIPYLGLFQNSNTFINSLLSVIGVNATSYLPLLSIDPLIVTVIPDDGSSPYDLLYDSISAPGVGQNILENPSYAPDFNLSGGSDNDIFVTGFGNDTLSGGTGNDRLDGGGGQDFLSGGEGNDRLDGGSSQDFLSGGEGNDQIYGGLGADTISGGTGDDIIWSDDPTQSRGADEIDGGAGNDIIHFDELDIVDGGDGWDIAIYASNLNTSSIDMDVVEHHLEVVVGGLGADTLSTDGSTETHLAGLDGNDTFNIEAGGGAPTVVWGGIGADTISVSSLDDSVGILVVDVSNLDADSFTRFDLNQIQGVGADIDWSQIDLVVLNPEVSDIFEINGSVVSVQTEDANAYYYEGDNFTEMLAGSVPYQNASDISGWEGFSDGRSVAANYGVSFLGGGVSSVFAAAAQIDFWTMDEHIDHLGYHYVEVETYDYEVSMNLDLDSDDITSPMFVNWRGVDTIFHFWVAYHGSPDGTDSYEILIDRPWAFGVASLDQFGPFEDASYMGPWFVVGGSFSGSALVAGGAGGNLTATIPNAQGGTEAGSGATEVSSGGGVHTIHSFDVTQNVVLLNGSPLNPNAPGGQVTLNQNDSDTEIVENGALLVTLVGVSLSAWQTAAAAQNLGSATDETLTGTSAAEVVASGAGNDTIIAAAGDDTIIYTSGNDVIVGIGTKNTGFDTLNLSKYASDQVSFTVNNNHDVLVTTPDGTIELDYQARYVVGDANNNIEQIVFSDTTLDEAAIRARALGDQSTSGDDNVQGSIQGDVIFDAAGNDTIMSAGGDDMIVYNSGNDVIVGMNVALNTGFDTLDLSKYLSNQVSFNVSGYDVLITTPDGVIELDYQIRYDLGHSRSNIEQILFSDGSLDEAGIRARSVADQTTTGADTITGTDFTDRIVGGLGNDVLAGGNGADTFVFAAGHGGDQIIDFALGSDLIEFAGLTFADLAISQSGNDTVIDYGSNDALLIIALDHTALTQSDFIFV